MGTARPPSLAGTLHCCSVTQGGAPGSCSLASRITHTTDVTREATPALPAHVRVLLKVLLQQLKADPSHSDT